MGNVYSIVSRGANVTSPAISEAKMDFPSGSCDEDAGDKAAENKTDHTDARVEARDKEMNEFKKQLNVKREQRREILSRHKDEKEQLKQTLLNEKNNKMILIKQNEMLRELLINNNIEIPADINLKAEDEEIVKELSFMRDELESLKNNNLKLRRNLAESNFSLQTAYSDMADLSQQNTEAIKQISALKEVIAVSKTLIGLREQQLNELKNKLNEIEMSLAEREASMLSTDLRQEYERQLQNIRTLRSLYEERARLAEVTRQGLVRELEEQKVFNQVEVNKCKELLSKINELEGYISSLKQTLETKQEQIRFIEIENQGIKSEMSVVNKLFSQVLLGYKTKQDLDKLVHRLEENHELLTQMAEKDDGSEDSSALPKLLLELVSQVDEVDKIETLSAGCQDNNLGSQTTTAAEIVQNLPKVWRVLMELLSHQSLAEPTEMNKKVTTCYKSIETNSGSVLVPSVSQTYIRLKDLIMEKLALIKEVNRMKQLNTHLESRLGEQESRLCLVTTELSKTWHVVGRLRRHHHQLHTHEKILKYELQQKRKLLNELKEELDYCKEKWDQAKEKNNQSEKDWRKLRAEFSSRKTMSLSSCNNSAESGYSDERPSDDSSESNDDSEYINEPLTRCKKKVKSSYETVIDSSTDFHVAEREDPASDMLDVAELPLDSQEGDDNDESVMKIMKNEKGCTETEDEFCDIGNDSIVEDIPSVIEENFDNKIASESSHIAFTSDDMQETVNSTTNPISILQSIQEPNERLAEKDKKSDLIKSTLDHTLNRPSCSKENQDHCETESKTFEIKTVSDCPIIDPKAIIESIRKQNERLAKKDERLNELESGCSKVIQMLSTTVDNSKQISEQIDTLHLNKAQYKNDNEDLNNKIDEKKSNEICEVDQNCSSEIVENVIDESDNIERTEKTPSDDFEPSTSAEVDHEARFAARDLRLKRLEEQTKSLVKKVNKTNSKGVKINYKLEELHNIYGSEGSRSGTPFDDNSVESNDDDSVAD